MIITVSQMRTLFICCNITINNENGWKDEMARENTCRRMVSILYIYCLIFHFHPPTAPRNDHMKDIIAEDMTKSIKEQTIRI